MTPESERAELLRAYGIYDTSNDIVSAFEALFTTQADFASRVVHFERFPKIRVSAQAELTPDFTVVFEGGYGLVGEIKNLPLSDDGVDDSCDQIGKYLDFIELPGPSGVLVPVSVVDVMLVVPHGDSNRAVDRIIVDRFRSEAHPAHRPEPSTVPIIVGHTRTAANYAFVRNRDPNNGEIRDAVLDNFINVNGFKAVNAFWTPTKVNNRFMNDPTPPLYMATVIATGVIPVLLGGQQELVVDLTAIHSHVETLFGRASLRDVRKGMDLLSRSGHATAGADGNYTIRRPRLTGRQELHEQIAERATSPTTGGRISRATGAPTPPTPTEQEPLF